MTTKHSPLSAIKKQADEIARVLKAIERGETVPNDVGGKVAASRNRDSIIFGVVMDDKVLKISITWADVRKFSETSISEYITKAMKEQRDN